MKNSAFRNKPTQLESSYTPPLWKSDSVIHNQGTFVSLILVALLGALSLLPAAPAQAQSVPAAPTSLNVDPGNADLYMEWTAPTGTLTGYDVHYTSAPKTGNGAVTDSAAVQTGADSAGWVADDRGTEGSPPDDYHTISGLTNDVTYRVRVRAKNANGNGAWAFGSGTPTPPAPPTNLAVAPGDRQLTVTWTAPANFENISGYEIDFTSATVADDAEAIGTNPAVAWVASKLEINYDWISYTIDSDDATLVNGVTYRVRIRTVSPNSAYVFASGTPWANTPPANVTAQPGDASFTVSWSEVAGAETYKIEWGPSSESGFLLVARADAPATSIRLEHDSSVPQANIVNGTTYKVRVAACVNDGNDCSAWSPTVTVTPDGGAETPTVSLSASPNPVTEGQNVTVTATVSEALSSAVTIPVTITDDTAESGDHGTLTSITINANATSGTGTISTNQDADEADETFTVALDTANLPSSVTAGTPSSVLVRISDDDSRYVLSVDATPACGTRVTDTSVTPTMQRVLTPAPRTPEAVQYRLLADAPDQWIGTNHPIKTSGRSARTESASFDHLRNRFAGFRGFEYRLTDRTGVTAQCTWEFSGQTITDDTDDDTTRTPPPVTPAPPTGGAPPPAGPSDPTPDSDTPARCGESDTEDLERFYEATGGDAWYRSEDWNSEEPLDQWFGVGTDEDGEVISLRLSDNNLSGDMPTEELLCLNENTELKELALWDNEDLSGDVPEELVLAVERAALRDIAEMLDINPEWFEDYEDPFNFEDWYEGVTTDDEGRVTELDLPGEIPESIRSQFKELREIMITTSDGGCALSPEGSSAFSLFFLTLLVFAVVVRKRAR